jgi:hypothetical protein
MTMAAEAERRANVSGGGREDVESTRHAMKSREGVRGGVLSVAGDMAALLLKMATIRTVYGSDAFLSNMRQPSHYFL